jgi:hypothetical protein
VHRKSRFLPHQLFLSTPAPLHQSNGPSFHTTSTTMRSIIFGRFSSWTWYPDNRGQRRKIPPIRPQTKAATRGLFLFRRPVHAAALPSRSTSHPGHTPPAPPAKMPLQRALVATACHSPKEPFANPRGCNHLPQSQPQGGPPSSAPNEVLLMRTNASFQEIHSCASRN